MNRKKIVDVFWNHTYYIRNPKQIFYSIKWHAQRKFKGYSDLDVWSTDLSLSKIIFKRLTLFKNSERHSYPNDRITPELWEIYLDKMIEAFRIHSENEYYSPEDDFSDIDMKVSEDGRIKIISDDVRSAARLEHLKQAEAKFEEGMRLFAVYFRDLWD